MKHKLALQLPAYLHDWAQAQASASGFENAGEFIQHILIEKRRLEARDRIEQKLLQAIEDDEEFELTDDHFDELEQKIKTLAKKKNRHAVKR